MQELSISISQLLGVSSSIATLIAIVIGASWSIYFNRIKEGQKTEFAKQLEILKSKNEKINYITKAQFDAEFKMYQELSEACFNMLLNNTALFPKGIDFLPEDQEQRNKEYQKRYKLALDSLIIYQNLLFKYAPFISKDLYNKFEELRKMGQQQVNWYPDFRLNQENRALVSTDLLEQERACAQRTIDMEYGHKDLIEDLRNYLKTLKVHED